MTSYCSVVLVLAMMMMMMMMMMTVLLGHHCHHCHHCHNNCHSYTTTAAAATIGRGRPGDKCLTVCECLVPTPGRIPLLLMLPTRITKFHHNNIRWGRCIRWQIKRRSGTGWRILPSHPLRRETILIQLNPDSQNMPQMSCLTWKPWMLYLRRSATRTSNPCSIHGNTIWHTSNLRYRHVQNNWWRINSMNNQLWYRNTCNEIAS